MRLGLRIPAVSWQGGPAHLRSSLAEIARTAEAVGFDTLDVADHVWQHPIMGGPREPQLEAYTTLGFVAAHTERVRWVRRWAPALAVRTVGYRRRSAGRAR